MYPAAVKTKIVKLDTAKMDTVEIDKAAKIIDAGGLVVFPTETVYGIACRVKADSFKKLDTLKGRSSEKYYTLHIGQKTKVQNYVSALSPKAVKLVNNTWPGPLTIVFQLSDEDIKKQQKTLPKEIFRNLYKNNSIGIRCPEHPVATALLTATKFPVVAPSANRAGEKPAINATQALEQLSGQIELLLDAGPCKYQKSSTVVKMAKSRLEVLRQGVYSAEELENLSKLQILFVCTGNTCRSPMAEGIFTKYLAEKLACNLDELEKTGYKVLSAGTLGIVGMPASDEAVAVCSTKGIDIRSHKSSALTRELIDSSDFIFVMSRAHRQLVIDACETAATKCILLAGNKEIPDPIGQSREVYENCEDKIEKAVRKIIGGLMI